jgi:hypothetical protein
LFFAGSNAPTGLQVADTKLARLDLGYDVAIGSFTSGPNSVFGFASLTLMV